ncbi:MAG: L-fuculose-phosphate aldolase [Baekduia sp.]|jgi:L-fuculose-phosphate aldolase|nr:L-fuculose-phosphate aldolase [Baekduia sp.]
MQPGSLERERVQLAAACRRLAVAGLVHGTAGNLSVRHGDVIAITPTGAQLESLEAGDVTLIDATGEVVGGGLRPTSELDLHLAVYERYGAGAVVHTHAPMSTAVSCVLEELPCVHYEMVLLGGSVRVAPYTTFATPELAAAAVDALQGRTAALLANHGTVTFGADLDGAVRATELLEWAATLYWRAAQLGTPRVLDEAELADVLTVAARRSYGTTQPVDDA